MEYQSYKDLIFWQKAIDFSVIIYGITEKFPRSEMYGLSDQLRRASVSVPSNIAEGHGRQSYGDYSKFLSNANGSLCEIETQLLIALKLNYISQSDYDALISQALEIGKMLRSYWKKIRDLR